MNTSILEKNKYKESIISHVPSVFRCFLPTILKEKTKDFKKYGSMNIIKKKYPVYVVMA